jgi:hypothetical protein
MVPASALMFATNLHAQTPRTQVGIEFAVDTKTHFDGQPHPKGVVGNVVVHVKDTGAIAFAVVGAVGRTSVHEVTPVFSKEYHAMSFIGGARVGMLTGTRFRPFGEFLAGGLRYTHDEEVSDIFGTGFSDHSTHWGGTVGGGAGIDVVMTRRAVLSVEVFGGHALRRVTAGVSIGFGRSR